LPLPEKCKFCGAERTETSPKPQLSQELYLRKVSYQDLPVDFTDLSLIAISERLNISAIATLDKDFNIYRRYRKQSFDRVFL
jgi:uncharacterized protein